MEPSEIELLRSNYFNLCRLTNCSEELLSFFYENKILSLMDMETIESKTKGFQRASEFYRIIQTKTNAFAVLFEGLRKTRQLGAIKLLSEVEDWELPVFMDAVDSGLTTSPGPSSRVKAGISFEVFPPVHSFAGRAKEVQNLHKLVLKKRQAVSVTITSQLTCLVGLGGIGKTQLARYYVQRYAKHFNGNVIWLNAETEHGLADCFKRFGTSLFLSNQYTKSTKQVVAKVFKYFEVSKALFVFDNAEKVPWLKNFFPMTFKHSNLHILITSREQEWDRGVEVMQLDGLSQNDAVLLVKSGLKITTADKNLNKDILELVDLLQFYPLALQQAIAYIYEQQITSSFFVKDYLQEMKIKEQEMLSFQDTSIYEETFTATTATIWRLTVDKIKADLEHGHLASLILNIVAYLCPDNIHRDLFYRLQSLNLVFDNSIFYFERINAAVRLLVRYSMLIGRENQTVLSVHRLVQAVTRNQLVQAGIEEQVLKVAVLIFNFKTKELFPNEYIPHALIVWRNAWKYNKLIQMYTWHICKILWKMAYNAHEEGEQFGKEALVRLEKVLGANHKRCLYVQNFIARFLTYEENFEKAIAILKDIQLKAESLFVKDKALCLTIKGNLAVTTLLSGKFDEAVKIGKDLVENYKNQFSALNLSTLAEANHRIEFLDIGDMSNGLEVFGKVLNYMSENTENSKDVLKLQGLIAVVYFQMGNYKKPTDILEADFQIVKPNRIYQRNTLVRICWRLGVLLDLHGKYDYKVTHFDLQETLKDIEDRITDRNNLKTVELQILMGAKYERLKNFEKAIELNESAMAWVATNLGKNSIQYKTLSDHIDALKQNTRKGLTLLFYRFKCHLFCFVVVLICGVVIFPIVFI